MIKTFGYTILDSIDLADINQDTGSAYNFFQKNYKTVFAPNERLILYSSYSPSQDLIDHIQRASSLVDISNSFITIVCPHDLTKKIDSATKNYSFDSVPFNYICFDPESKILPKDKFIKETPNLCPLPWMNLDLGTLGDFAPCCFYKEKLGNITEFSIADAFKTLEPIQKRFLSGEYLPECNHCWKLEKIGIQSLRQYYLSNFKQLFFSELLDTPKLKTLNLHIGNLCNFRCRICDPAASSRVASEQLIIATSDSEKQKIRNIIKKSKWFDQDSKFFDELIDNLQHIVNLDFFGGEPFLIRGLDQFLQKLIDLGLNKQIRLHFSTNGSIYNQKLYDLIKQFKEVNIGFSIDDIGQRFEYQRGGEWHAVEKNINMWKSKSDQNVVLEIHPTINIQNVFYLDQILSWIESLELPIYVNILQQPEELCIDNMTDLAKEMFLSKYQNSSNDTIQSLVTRVSNTPSVSGEEFKKYMFKLDKVRNTNFSDAHKEIANAMGYDYSKEQLRTL